MEKQCISIVSVTSVNQEWNLGFFEMSLPIDLANISSFDFFVKKVQNSNSFKKVKSDFKKIQLCKSPYFFYWLFSYAKSFN